MKMLINEQYKLIFLRFLKEYSCYKQFFNSADKEKINKFFKDNSLNFNLVEIINRTMTWSWTREGREFWYEKCLDWCYYLYTMSDESDKVAKILIRSFYKDYLDKYNNGMDSDFRNFHIAKFNEIENLME